MVNICQNSKAPLQHTHGTHRQDILKFKISGNEPLKRAASYNNNRNDIILSADWKQVSTPGTFESGLEAYIARSDSWKICRETVRYFKFKKKWRKTDKRTSELLVTWDYYINMIP